MLYRSKTVTEDRSNIVVLNECRYLLKAMGFYILQNIVENM